jgi:hypothetical protein
MEREDDSQLWDLLSHSKRFEPSPFFARNVVRAVRAESSSPRNITSWFQLRRLIPSLSALAALVIAAFTLYTLHNNRSGRAGGSDQIAAMELANAELATDLDVLSGDDDADDAPLL